MKTKSEELNLFWCELQRIFMDYKKLTSKVIKDLEGLGFKVDKGKNHTKIIMPVGIMVISNTPSDKQAGRQILRQIRRMYESDKTMGNKN